MSAEISNRKYVQENNPTSDRAPPMVSAARFSHR